MRLKEPPSLLSCAGRGFLLQLKKIKLTFSGHWPSVRLCACHIPQIIFFPLLSTLVTISLFSMLVSPFLFLFFVGLFCFSVWPHHAACGISVPWPGIEHKSPAVEAQSLKNWMATEILWVYFYFHTTFLKPVLCWWALALFTCLGYCKQGFCEHWGACIFSN